jgi:hypothetical protein
MAAVLRQLGFYTLDSNVEKEGKSNLEVLNLFLLV